jgi:hypothetical protein
MKNRMDLEEGSPVWTAYLHFNNFWKCKRESHLLFVDCVKAFDLVARKNHGK